MIKRPPARPKTPSKQGMLGQLGINLIESIVLKMPSLWHVGGPNEVGIDGMIELCDPTSNHSLTKVLGVQSKAVTNFLNETDSGFEFRCERRDVEYWLQGNLPILLIVSKPSAGEAYWIPVKEYFAAKETQASLTVHFQKSENRFIPDSIHQLIRLGVDADRGLYLPPDPKNETLLSNLLPLDSFPEKIYLAETDARTPGEVIARLRASHTPRSGWFFNRRQIFSFKDLSESSWADVCDPNSVEAHDTTYWSESNDPDTMRQFVQLLNQTLRVELPDRVRYWPKEGLYAFRGSLRGGTLKVPYPALKIESHLSAVTKYEKEFQGRKYTSLRHMAFEGQFRRFEGTWYLEITPSYLFTRDGEQIHFIHEKLLKGIKEFEGNRAVLSQVMFWAHALKTKGDLFERTDKALHFRDLLTFELPVGLSDTEWKAKDENPPPGEAADDIGIEMDFEGPDAQEGQ
jgi:hypothetical protein